MSVKSAITIRIPNEMRKDLERLSKSENVPVSDLIRESLVGYLAVKKFRRLRKKILPFAEAAGLLADDDVFKIIS